MANTSSAKKAARQTLRRTFPLHPTSAPCIVHLLVLDTACNSSCSIASVITVAWSGTGGMHTESMK